MRDLYALLRAWGGPEAEPIDAQAGRRPLPQARFAGADPAAVAYDPAANQHDLAAQGWAILFAQGGLTPQIEGALAPLLALRQAQAGRIGRIELGPAPPTDVAGALDWLHDVFRAVPVAERPGYVLIIGDLDAVPLAIQQVLATEICVGRLAFDAADGYRAYAEKIARKACVARAEAWFYSAADGTRAVELGERVMIRRGAPTLARAGAERFATIGICDALTGGPIAGPNVLFTLSHGLGPPPGGWSPADRRLRQGSLQIGPTEVLDPAAAAQGAWLPGGIWFAFACFSAGTPHASVYAPLIERQAASLLANLAARPFVSATAKALLANPEGPVGFIGHVDLAWAYSFTEQAAGRRRQGHARFTEVMRRLGIDPRVGPWRQGGPGRAGFALAAIRDAIHDLDAALARRRDDPVLWMTRMDLEGFVLLGDPAAHLALRSPDLQIDVDAAARAALRRLEVPIEGAIRAALAAAPPEALAAIVEGRAADDWMARVKARLGIADG